MKKIVDVSLVPMKFKYLFDSMDYLMVENEEDGNAYRIDKMVMESFHGDVLEQLIKDYKIDRDNGWGIVHLDGDIYNNREDNLEYAVFLDNNPVLEEKENLENEVKELKEQIRQLKREVNLYKGEVKIAKNRERISNEKFEYISNLNKELNKEIRKKENEAKKYWQLLNNK